MNVLLPQNIDAERSVLGAVLLDSQTLLDITEILKPEDFYRKDHEMIYNSMLRVISKNQTVDVVTVTDDLTNKGELDKVGGISYIISLTEDVPLSSNAKQYANIVAEKAIQRRLIKGASEITAMAYEPEGDIPQLLEKSEKIIFDIVQRKTSKPYLRLGEILPDVYNSISELSLSGILPGIPTGFTEIDKMLSGLHNSDLILIAARPGMGKTSLMMNIAQYVAINENIPVAVFNLEMSSHQLVNRVLSSEAGVINEHIRSGQLTPTDWDAISDVFPSMCDAPLYFDDSTDITVSAIRAKCRKLKIEKDIKLVVIDYLQLMQSGAKNDNRVTEVSDISRSLKVMARELNIPVIVGSQLSRDVEKRADKRPVLSDLRESGAIEQDADIVMFIYRDDYYNKNAELSNIAQISIAKHRNGATGSVNLCFIPEKMTFVNADN